MLYSTEYCTVQNVSSRSSGSVRFCGAWYLRGFWVDILVPLGGLLRTSSPPSCPISTSCTTDCTTSHCTLKVSDPSADDRKFAIVSGREALLGGPLSLGVLPCVCLCVPVPVSPGVSLLLCPCCVLAILPVAVPVAVVSAVVNAVKVVNGGKCSLCSSLPAALSSGRDMGEPENKHHQPHNPSTINHQPGNPQSTAQKAKSKSQTLKSNNRYPNNSTVSQCRIPFSTTGFRDPNSLYPGSLSRAASLPSNLSCLLCQLSWLPWYGPALLLQIPTPLY